MCSVPGLWKPKVIEALKGVQRIWFRHRGREMCHVIIGHCFVTREQLSSWAVVWVSCRLSAERMLFGAFVPVPLHLWSTIAKWRDLLWSTHGYRVRNGWDFVCLDTWVAITQVLTMVLWLCICIRWQQECHNLLCAFFYGKSKQECVICEAWHSYLVFLRVDSRKLPHFNCLCWDTFETTWQKLIK